MSLDITKLLTEMGQAAADVLRSKWDSTKDYVESEFKKYLETVEFVKSMVDGKQMTKVRARLHMKAQREAMKNVLLTIEILGIVTVEEAINGAVNMVKDVINIYVGFNLL